MLAKRLATLLLAAGSASGVWAQYMGPTILSRDVTQVGTYADEPVRFHAYGSVNGIYDNGILQPSLNQTNQQQSVDLSGVELEWGVTGTKKFSHSILGLSYQGDYRGYPGGSYYNGTDHVALLEYQRNFTKRLLWTIRPEGGTLSRSSGGLLTTPYLDPTVANVPTLELFDTRLYFGSATTDLTYLLTNRQSINIGGQGFVIDRRSNALVGVAGFGAHADYAYRITKNQTIDGEYTYNQYTYRRGFGDFDAHSVALGYADRINRFWQLNLRAGIYRVESRGLERVAIDPALVDLFGQFDTVQIGYRKRYLPLYDALLTYRRKEGTYTLAYTRRLNPGNGVLLLSREETAYLGYSRVFSQKLNVGVSGGWSRITGIEETGGAFDNYYGGGGLTYQLYKHMFLNSRVDFRRYSVVNNPFLADTYRVAVGLAFSTEDVPLRLY